MTLPNGMIQTLMGLVTILMIVHSSSEPHTSPRAVQTEIQMATQMRMTNSQMILMIGMMLMEMESAIIPMHFLMIQKNG